MQPVGPSQEIFGRWQSSYLVRPLGVTAIESFLHLFVSSIKSKGCGVKTWGCAQPGMTNKKTS